MIFKHKQIDLITPKIARYKNGGNVKQFDEGGLVTSGELLEDIADIELVLEQDANLTDNEKAQLNDVLQDLLNKKATLDNPVITESDVSDEQSNYTSEWLVNGNFFRDKNEKVLGSIRIDKDRYQKEIRVVEGSIANINDIDVSDNFAQFILKDDVAVTVKQKTLTEKLEDPDNESFIDTIIEDSKKR